MGNETLSKVVHPLRDFCSQPGIDVWINSSAGLPSPDPATRNRPDTVNSQRPDTLYKCLGKRNADQLDEAWRMSQGKTWRKSLKPTRSGAAN